MKSKDRAVLDAVNHAWLAVQSYLNFLRRRIAFFQRRWIHFADDVARRQSQKAESGAGPQSLAHTVDEQKKQSKVNEKTIRSDIAGYQRNSVLDANQHCHRESEGVDKEGERNLAKWIAINHRDDSRSQLRARQLDRDENGGRNEHDERERRTRNRAHDRARRVGINVHFPTEVAIDACDQHD